MFPSREFLAEGMVHRHEEPNLIRLMRVLVKEPPKDTGVVLVRRVEAPTEDGDGLAHVGYTPVDTGWL